MAKSRKRRIDPLSPAQRSERMSRIRSKGTKPELAVRALLRQLGLKYRTHVRELPGSPDFVISASRRAIFVHGCFWHQHRPCGIYRMPKTRLDFWVPKLQRNRSRDRANRAELRRLGWRYLIIWECQLRDPDRLAARIKRFVEASNAIR